MFFPKGHSLAGCELTKATVIESLWNKEELGLSPDDAWVLPFYLDHSDFKGEVRVEIVLVLGVWNA